MYYYAECRLNGKTALIGGPFLDESDASWALELLAPIAVNDQKLLLSMATFGVMSVKETCGAGNYNEYLPSGMYAKCLTNLVGIPLIQKEGNA